ncbi:MAG: peptide-methionine (S)-S-oxide reductase MsrA [Bacteroidetes bacterium SB0662_bin_6]|nr:peptide-methionine (S)-S-oxide reductase MsrA [Bacteroidetes bacterium SB0668_bin_1]MYE04297.1 peptide-methionine (S)-S-oxide reductase MsrA [Bacteroidetes bacterium SB0662_bin_6]
MTMMEQATLGGGCFWCLEAVFEPLRGIRKIVPGYAGGHVPDPTYRQVCTGRTGHAEVVQIDFDPSEISYRDVLNIFFTMHDPTTPDRQGGDVGPQYRSIILHHDEAQATAAQSVLAEFDGKGIWHNPIVTEIEPLDTFYPAEEEHHAYYRDNTRQPYCRIVIAPKVAKLRKEYAARLK